MTSSNTQPRGGELKSRQVKYNLNTIVQYSIFISVAVAEQLKHTQVSYQNILLYSCSRTLSGGQLVWKGFSPESEYRIGPVGEQPTESIAVKHREHGME